MEHSDEVMHAIQMRFKGMSVTDKNANDLSDFGVDPSNTQAAITSDDIKKSYNAPSNGTSVDCKFCKIPLDLLLHLSHTSKVFF